MLACATRLGVRADTVSRCRHVGLVLFLVRLGQTNVLAYTTQLGVGADLVRCRCRHVKKVQTCGVGLIFGYVRQNSCACMCHTVRPRCRHSK